MYRLICILLASVAFVALIALPDGDLPFGTYALMLLASKCVALIAFYATYLILQKYEPKTNRHH